MTHAIWLLTTICLIKTIGLIYLSFN